MANRELISGLDDGTAVRIASTLAGLYQRQEGFVDRPSADLMQALGAEFGAEVPSGPVSEGELARAILLLLAEDPGMGDRIEQMIDGPAVKTFAIGTTGAVLAALVLLQLHVKIARDKDGRWTFHMEKKPTAPALLKPLIAKLVACFHP